MWRMTKVMSSDCDMNVVKTECNESLSNGMQAKQCETPRPSSFLVDFISINFSSLKFIQLQSTEGGGQERHKGGA